jgi:hypothetical protein
MVRRFTGLEKKLTNSGPFMESTSKHSIYPYRRKRRAKSDLGLGEHQVSGDEERLEHSCGIALTYIFDVGA